MLNDRNGDGLGMLPRPGEPESFLQPGMAAPRMPVIRPARAVGSLWEEAGRIMRQTPRGPVVVVPDPPGIPAWNYDFNPATGNARAQWVGECLVNGSAVATGAAAVLSFNTRTGAVTLSQADVGAVAPQSFNGRIGAVVPVQGDYSANLIPGTTTNDNAAAGNIGELISGSVARASAITMATATRQNLVTLALTAGDWDVDAAVYVPSGGATVQSLRCSLSLVSATDDLTPGRVGYYPTSGTPFANDDGYLPIAPTRFSLSGATNVFFVVVAFFTVGSVTMYGTARARRAR